MPRPLIADRVADLLRLGVAGALGLALLGSWTTVQVLAQGDRDEQRPVDAIVVLGAAQYDGRPSPIFEARLDHAIGLYFAGVAPVIVMTGGKAEGDRVTEADSGRTYALEHDVPSEAILLEDDGRNTLHSLSNVADLMRGHELRTAIFVSDRTHMLRVLRIAGDLGIEGYGSPTPSSPMEQDLRARTGAIAHELGALAVYFLIGGTPAVELERG